MLTLEEFSKEYNSALATYQNGNHFVAIYPDGTKIKETIDPAADHFTYDFPENFDLKINNRCDGGCPYCHENSTPNGEVPDLKKFADSELINSLHPGTEIAIGGGNIFESPDLEYFLQKLKEKQILANITVNQRHVKKNFDSLKHFVYSGLVHGVGISLTSHNKEDFELIDKLGDNVVIHTINGILEKSDIRFLMNRKVLILGYKDLRRGHDLLSTPNMSASGTWGDKIKRNQKWLKRNLNFLRKNVFRLVSFDCLALEQLNPKEVCHVSDSDWNTLFQGADIDVRDSDGNITCATMFLDLPNKKVARMSTAPLDKREDFEYTETIEKLFEKSVKNWS